MALGREDFSPLEWGGMAGARGLDGRSFIVDEEAESTAELGVKPGGGLTFKGPLLQTGPSSKACKIVP